jgi:phosphatidylglycerol---prolipoprotein diacylglyceryl transferase
MIPYHPQPIFHVGPFEIHAFGITAIIAILASGWIIVRRGRRAGFPGEDLFQLWFWMYLGAALGAHLFSSVIDDFPQFLADPARVFHFQGISSIGAGSVAFVAGLLWCLVRRLSLFDSLRLLDIVAFAMPFAWTFGRLGCALAHDHLGSASTSWIAVRFPTGPRYDLGLIEFLLLIGMSAVFLVADRKQRPVGFFTGLVGVLYGAIRICVAAFSGEHTRFYGGAVSVLIGLLVWTAMSTLKRPGNHPFNRLAPARNV